MSEESDFEAAIEPFLAASNILISKVVATGRATDIDATTLSNAEAFLAAHLYSQSGAGKDAQTIESEQFENYMTKYASRSGPAMAWITSTGYGQTANLLLNGLLAEVLGTKASIEFF